jgi:DNA-binding CsgD family transcriptional regulator/tetratricopeptide (TPR) repeat protein
MDARPLVGRERELGELERALDAAREGRGGTVLLAGEAGIGKTRLASEAAATAAATGFEVLVGRSIDLVGSELPYQPFVDALGPLGEPAGSQLRVFREALALLDDRAAAAPVLLVLEDLHWADASSLDLTVFAAHNVDARPVLVLGTYRPDEPASAERMRRLADGVRRSGSAVVLEVGPLADEELTALLADRADAAVAGEIARRAEGNPFFAEELLAAGADLPAHLRDVLLQRVRRLDAPTQGLLRLVAGAGRDVSYALVAAASQLPEHDVRESLREGVEHGVLVADQAAASFRFRHALLAEAVYATVLPGEREELHGRLAEELARSGAASPAELAPHWAAAGRAAEALGASVEAARLADAVFAAPEARAHLERALALWDAVPDAEERAGVDLAEICARAAALASNTGAAPRAVELVRQAIAVVGPDDARRAALLHIDLGEYLHETGASDEAYAALERAAELVQGEEASPERAYAVASLAARLMLEGRYAESLPVAEQALALARNVGSGEAEVRALTVLGGDLAYLGRAEEGLAAFAEARELAEEVGDHLGLERAYANLTDALTAVGRPRESARVAEEALVVVRRYARDETILLANWVEALLAIGDWDRADDLSAAGMRRVAANFPYSLPLLRADLETGRGDFSAARRHLDEARETLREPRGLAVHAWYGAELALWERRWTDAVTVADDGLARVSSRESAYIRLPLQAKGLRALAELAALARARRDEGAVREHLVRADVRLDAARTDADAAVPVTPNATAWLALAEAERERAHGAPRSDLWAASAAAFDRVERPPVAAYCRVRQAEALVAAGAGRAEAADPLQDAYAVASRLGARPLLRDLELLAERARLDLVPPDPEAGDRDDLAETLGLTPREAEVLALVAHGLTNREIAATLVISTKTASVHVSHILRKLDAPNRLEAAAIAHRLAAPGSAR